MNGIMDSPSPTYLMPDGGLLVLVPFHAAAPYEGEPYFSILYFET